MRTALALALAVLLGCSHDAKPTVQPDDHPPLPPASGTPIGYLIDDATELQLRDEQLTQLQAIDLDLSERLEALDAQLRGPAAASGSASPQASGRHRGGRHGGGGRRGGFGGGTASGSGAGSGNSARPSPSRGTNPNSVNRVTEDRATDVRTALERAFALLDPAQQQIARRVLSDHGVDVDTDPSEAAPAAPGTGSNGN